MLWKPILAAASLAACAGSSEPPVYENIEQAIRLSQIYRLALSCDDGCRLLDYESNADGGIAYTDLAGDCGATAARTCVWNDEFIQLFEPITSGSRWSYNGYTYVRSEHQTVESAQPYTIIQQFRNGDRDKTYLLFADRFYMLAHTSMICSGEHGVCYSQSHASTIIFEITR